MGSSKKMARLEYLKKQINPDKMDMSQFCLAAHEVYEVWEEGGEDALHDYLLDIIGCSSEHALMIAKNYKPEHPPAEVCPIKSMENGSSAIFQSLSLWIGSIWPHNLLAWYLKRHVYGSNVFDFKIIGQGRGKETGIDFPSLMLDKEGHHLPFGLASLGVVEVGKLPAHAVKKAQTLIDKLGDEMGADLAITLLDAGFIFPPVKVLNQLVRAVERGRGGETVVLTGAFCPDYAYEETGRKDIPYRYTFDRVGTGVGLVAQQFQRVLPYLTDFMTRWGIPYRIQLGIGDFEANSKEILESVGVNKDEFTKRCAASLRAFEESVPNLEMDLRLFEAGWANGRFNQYTEEAAVRLTRGDYGKMRMHTGKDPYHEIRFIARDGKEFYRRWFKDPEMSLSEIERRVAEQLAEYAAVGRILKEDFGDSPFVVIAGDRPKMQIGGNMESDHPTLCCKRVY